MKKLKVGDVVAVEFLDHCQRTGDGGPAPLSCEVYGRIVHIDRTSYVIATWLTGGVVDQNAETFVILRSTVTKVRVLR